MNADVDGLILSQTKAEGPSTGSALRSFFLAGEVGRLEALLNEGRTDAPFSVLVCHPHPLGGGTMHNKVVYHAAKAFSGMGWPVLRFNFRGVGLSDGVHDGRAEVNDVKTALDWLAESYGRPVVVAGFSFGAAMGLWAASRFVKTGRRDIAGFAALGLPTHAEGRDYSYPYLEACRFPKLFVSGDRDQYAPLTQLAEIVAAAPEPKRFVAVAGADHFFTGHLAAMQEALRAWLSSTFAAELGTAAENTESDIL